MIKILGVDPGSACTGYGLVTGDRESFRYLASGAIKRPKDASWYEKLRQIFLDIGRVIEQFRPTQFAIEDVFFNKNPKSALVLGEARGAAILAATLADLPIYEYSAREVKRSVTGNGAAHKSQVNFMLGKILSLSDPPTNADESYALAGAMCHACKNPNRSPV